MSLQENLDSVLSESEIKSNFSKNLGTPLFPVRCCALECAIYGRCGKRNIGGGSAVESVTLTTFKSE